MISVILDTAICEWLQYLKKIDISFSISISKKSKKLEYPLLTNMN